MVARRRFIRGASGDGEDVENLISFTETGSHFRMVGMDKVRVSVQHGSVWTYRHPLVRSRGFQKHSGSVLRYWKRGTARGTWKVLLAAE